MQNEPCDLHTFKLKNELYKPSKMYDSQKLNFNKLWVPKYLNAIKSHTQKLNLKKKEFLEISKLKQQKNLHWTLWFVIHKH
jgi:hypothetical protein